MPFAPFIFLICLVAGIAYLICVKRKERELIEQVTPITRGEWSERRVVLKLLKAGINPKAIFHDLYIQKPNGTYTQVDVAVATKVGLIVFEVKDYSGWIFGNEKYKMWTQSLPQGKGRPAKKEKFLNRFDAFAPEGSSEYRNSVIFEFIYSRTLKAEQIKKRIKGVTDTYRKSYDATIVFILNTCSHFIPI